MREGGRERGEVPVSREDLAIDGSLLVSCRGHVERLTRSIVAYLATTIEAKEIIISRIRNVPQLIKFAGIG